MRYNVQANATVDTSEAAKSIIEKFNRRDKPKESQSEYFVRKQNETVERILKGIYKESFGVDLDSEAEAALDPASDVASEISEGAKYLDVDFDTYYRYENGEWTKKA